MKVDLQHCLPFLQGTHAHDQYSKGSVVYICLSTKENGTSVVS